jgi:hypothetical protein
MANWVIVWGNASATEGTCHDKVLALERMRATVRDMFLMHPVRTVEYAAMVDETGFEPVPPNRLVP